MFRYIFLALVLTLGVQADVTQALKAFKNKEYVVAFKLYEKEAKNGDTTAQNALSYLYFNGIGTAKNNEKGLSWLVKSAMGENVSAQYDLGMFYLTGVNAQQDSASAFTWLSKASDANNSKAQYNLALMYYRGDSIDQNVTKTAELLELSAASGHLVAQRNLSRIYMQLIRFDDALRWLKKDIIAGDNSAYYLTAEILCNQEKFKEAKPYAQKARKLGNKDADLLWMRYSLDKF